jgi:hypothetical protein
MSNEYDHIFSFEFLVGLLIINVSLPQENYELISLPDMLRPEHLHYLPKPNALNLTFLSGHKKHENHDFIFNPGLASA